MKSFVEFRSAKFPPCEGEEEEINPGIWGRRLGEYLAQRLSEKGIKVKGCFSEDWGWYLSIENEGFKIALVCGHQAGDDDQFLCFTSPKTPNVKKSVKKIDAAAQLTRVTEAMREILTSDPDIKDIVWTEPRG